MKKLSIILSLVLMHECALCARLNLTSLFETTARHHVFDPSIRGDDFYTAGNTRFDYFERTDRNLMLEYQSLCETRSRTIQLSDTQFEYQPPIYHEVYCKSQPFPEQQSLGKPTRQMCAHPSFHCVQRSRTLFVLRRRWTSECWEPFTRQIASGCDCMWPVATLGDISQHY